MQYKKLGRYFALFISSWFFQLAHAQEFNAKISIITAQLPTSVSKSVFTTMQSQLTSLVNKRKWSNDAFATNEKINCNIVINLSSVVTDDEYSGSILVQASRPVYGSSYSSPIINYQDKSFVFKYTQGQTLDFSMGMIAGYDPLISNLPAVVAYYLNLILGMEYDSYSFNAGAPYYKNAQMIVAGAPSDNAIKGWSVLDGLINRYYFAENLTSQRTNGIHRVIYNYYRQGLDQLSTNITAAQTNVLMALQELQKFDQEHPATMIKQQFLESKYMELIGIFKKAPVSTKNQARELLSQLDATHVAQYSSELN